MSGWHNSWEWGVVVEHGCSPMESSFLQVNEKITNSQLKQVFYKLKEEYFFFKLRKTKIVKWDRDPIWIKIKYDIENN